MVKGGDSKSRGPEFESQRWMLDRHLHIYLLLKDRKKIAQFLKSFDLTSKKYSYLQTICQFDDSAKSFLKKF